jgi:hypothetical protein
LNNGRHRCRQVFGKRLVFQKDDRAPAPAVGKFIELPQQASTLGGRQFAVRKAVELAFEFLG